MLEKGHESQSVLGWALPSLRLKSVNLLVFALGLSCGLTACMLGLVRETAEDTPLILSFAGACVLLFSVWLVSTLCLSREIFCETSVVSVKDKYCAATYDGAGSFFYGQGVLPYKADPSSEMQCCGCKFLPQISNGAVIKVAFATKCVLKGSSLALGFVKGALSEAGLLSEGMRWNLTAAVASMSALLVLDGALALAFGGEQSPCATFGKLLHRLIYGRDVGFEPVHRLAHSLQELIVTVEYSPWGLVIPLLHEYVYGMRVTSTWVLPILANFIGISYTIGAIFCKGCSLAFIIGSAVRGGILKPPGARRHREGITVKGISYSLWGPFVELETPHLAWAFSKPPEVLM